MRGKDAFFVFRFSTIQPEFAPMTDALKYKLSRRTVLQSAALRARGACSAQTAGRRGVGRWPVVVGGKSVALAIGRMG